MFRMCARNSHSYTHLILALGIVREPTVWVFITSKYPGTHDIGLPTIRYMRDSWNLMDAINYSCFVVTIALRIKMVNMCATRPGLHHTVGYPHTLHAPALGIHKTHTH